MASRSRRVALGVFAAAIAAYACTGGAPATPPSPPVVDAGLTVAEAKLKFDVDPGLACAGGNGICVAPSQVVTFGIDGVTGIAVSLSLQGAYADAALTAQEVTLAGAPVNVMLEAASTTATFTIVARVGGAGSAESVSLPVTVSQSGSATIEATPTYAGHRPDTELYAADFVLSTCAEITEVPPDAGADAWTEGAAGAAIPLTVPAGERVAVEVRIGHYAFGCSDVDPLVPDAGNAVPVQVYDIPMALSLTNLNAVFAFTPDATETSSWRAVAAAAVARIEGAFFPPTSADASVDGDGSALLDAMSRAIVLPVDQAQFAQLRKTNGWDLTASTWMASHTPSIRSRAATWLSAAETAEIGPLALHIGGEPSGDTTAPVTPLTLGPLDSVSAGISPPAPFVWTADANDIVHLFGAIDLASTPLFAHEADAQAAASVTSATDVPSAIAAGIDCTGLASSLVGSGVSYGTCSAACTATLCGSALSLAWKSATTAPAGADAVHTTITASAPASVGDLAEPAYVQGGWLGNVSGTGVPPDAGTDGSFSVSGTLLASEPTTFP